MGENTKKNREQTELAVVCGVVHGATSTAVALSGCTTLGLYTFANLACAGHTTKASTALSALSSHTCEVLWKKNSYMTSRLKKAVSPIAIKWAGTLGSDCLRHEKCAAHFKLLLEVKPLHLQSDNLPCQCACCDTVMIQYFAEYTSQCSCANTARKPCLSTVDKNADVIATIFEGKSLSTRYIYACHSQQLRPQRCAAARAGSRCPASYAPPGAGCAPTHRPAAKLTVIHREIFAMIHQNVLYYASVRRC
jgi:hypothetical protein